MSLQDKRILVTGGRGFLGRHVLEALDRRPTADVVAPSSRECDLRDAQAVARTLQEARPHVVIHMAGRVGGIGANRARPADFYYDNALMGLNVVEQCRRANVERLVLIGTICSYPKHAPIPMREHDLWNGYPEETNAPFGLASKMQGVHLQAAHQQYGMRGAWLLLVNIYGPHDNFDPDSSHVVPALMRRCIEARKRGDEKIVAWGSGKATREFLYVTDAAEAVARAAERCDDPDPINLGGTGEISIAELAEKIARATGYRGTIEWDATKPDGQPRRLLDGSRALERLDWAPTTSLDDGLRQTVEWYERVPLPR